MWWACDLQPKRVGPLNADFQIMKKHHSGCHEWVDLRTYLQTYVTTIFLEPKFLSECVGNKIFLHYTLGAPPRVQKLPNKHAPSSDNLINLGSFQASTTAHRRQVFPIYRQVKKIHIILPL